jgi:hypothetical protein
MALTTCTVTGRVALPDDTAPGTGFVVFLLNVADIDGDTLLPRAVKAPLGANGEVSVDLWPNARGSAGSAYTVQVELYAAAESPRPFVTVPLGSIQVPEDTTADLAALLNLQPATPIGQTVLAQVLAARDDAAASSVAAETARLLSEAAASRPTAGGPVGCATTDAIALSGEQTIDGVTTNGSRVLVKDQSNAAENGIYVSNPTAWARAADMDQAGEFLGASVAVSQGTANGGRTYYCATAVQTVEGDPVAFVLASEIAPLIDGKADQAAVDTLGRSAAQVSARSLPRDGYVGWADPVADRQGRIAGGWKDRAGTFAARSFQMAEADVPERDGSFGTPLARDGAGRVALAVKTDGSTHIYRLDGPTLAQLATDLSPVLTVNGQLIGGIPGWNHRGYDDQHWLVTMPTFFGPVDVLYPKTGSGLQLAATNLPPELLSMSGQSNMQDGGDADHPYGLFNKLKDPHRALMPSPRAYWGDGTGSAAAYASGDISALVPAVQIYEAAGSNQIAMYPMILSAIACDQREQRQQRLYAVAASFEGGTPLSEYLAGQTKGDNIAAYVPAIETMVQASYGRNPIMYAHFLFGHESPSYVAPYGSYGEMLSAFADQVCGTGEALDANVAAGVRPKVIVYQPNDGIGTADNKTIVQSALDTLAVALSDDDVICVGPVYHEKTVDSGIHMVAKAQTCELMAHAYDLVRAGLDFVPLHVSGASLSGAVITATLSGPSGFVTLDDDWLPTLTDGGLYYDDDSHSAAIASVAIVNTSATVRELTITLDATPSGANPKLYIGGLNNAADGGHPGGMASFYVAGPKSFWHRNGFERWTTPELRFYLCRDVVAVS